MNKFFDIIPWVVIPILLVLVIFFSKYKTLLENINSDRLKLIKNEFPDLTNNDIKYNKAALENYKKWYFYTPLQRRINIMFASALLLSVVGLIHYIIWFKSLYITVGFITLFFFVTLLVWVTSPSLEQQQKFLKKYLKENPDNEFKVVLFNDSYTKKIAKAAKVQVIVLSIIVILFLLLTLSFWYNSI